MAHRWSVYIIAVCLFALLAIACRIRFGQFYLSMPTLPTLTWGSWVTRPRLPMRQTQQIFWFSELQRTWVPTVEYGSICLSRRNKCTWFFWACTWIGIDSCISSIWNSLVRALLIRIVFLLKSTHNTSTLWTLTCRCSGEKLCFRS